MPLQQHHRVFLSYSHSNKRACKTLFDLLRDSGHEVWWDERRLKGGDFIWDTIFDRINQASSFIVLLSETALKSSYVEMEVNLAGERDRQGYLDAFVPVVVRPCAAEDDPRFKDRVILNATRGIAKVRAKLLRALPTTTKSLKSQTPVTPQSYFDFILPAMLKWYGDEATSIDATIYFNLYDSGGGKWTMILRAPEPQVVHGEVDNPDLEIHITVAEMINMLTGFFDARNAIAKGNLHVAGNMELLRSVGQLLSGHRSANVQNGRKIN